LAATGERNTRGRFTTDTLLDAAFAMRPPHRLSSTVSAWPLPRDQSLGSYGKQRPCEIDHLSVIRSGGVAKVASGHSAAVRYPASIYRRSLLQLRMALTDHPSQRRRLVDAQRDPGIDSNVVSPGRCRSADDPEALSIPVKPDRDDIWPAIAIEASQPGQQSTLEERIALIRLKGPPLNSSCVGFRITSIRAVHVLLQDGAPQWIS
jgi:hypothetical protein